MGNDDQAEISSQAVKPGWKFQPGLKLSSCNRSHLNFKKICSGSQPEISAWLIGLKFIM